MKKQNSKKTWTSWFLITTITLSVIGLTKIILDNNCFNDNQYLITAIIFGTAVFLIKTNKVIPYFQNSLITIGFIFSIFGLVSSLEIK